MEKRRYVTFAIREDLHSQAKIIAILKKVPLGRYLESCIEESLKEDKKLLKQVKSIK